MKKPAAKLGKEIEKLEKQMYQHARDLEFEEAARTRDKLRKLEEILKSGKLA